MSNDNKTLIDTGFDSDYSITRINEFSNIFASEEALQEFVYRIHDEDNTLDMKRGEFYPEILRCILSFKRAISSIYDIDEAQCHPNFGCNGCIDTILMAMKLREINRKIDTETEGGMLVSTPTYFRNYASAHAKQIKIIKVPLKKTDWEIDIDLFLKKLTTSRPTVVFLVTPNNPSGIAIKDSHICQIIEEAPDETLVVIDRTLVNINDQITTKALLKTYSHKQLVILHSFSKYRGLSHLRVGCALYSNINVAREIQPHLPLGLGVEGLIKATKYLKEDGIIKPTQSILNNVKSSKEILKLFCKEYNDFSFTDFSGNYCLLLLPSRMTSTYVVEKLKKDGIYVMGGLDFPEPIDSVLRLHTGGKPEFMQITVNALKKISSDIN